MDVQILGRIWLAVKVTQYLDGNPVFYYNVNECQKYSAVSVHSDSGHRQKSPRPDKILCLLVWASANHNFFFFFL